MRKKIRIGTRESKLALVQTELVVERLKQAWPTLEIVVVPMTTKGDQNLNRSLASFGGKGVFTKELEVALLDNRIDLAVHSAKDMPMEFPNGLTMGAVLEREDPADVLITMDGTNIQDMQPNSVIGTSSLRRELQIKKQNPDVVIKVLRGNVLTRLAKLESGAYDGIILAAAGLKRLEIEAFPKTKYHMERLLSDTFLPAPGQGILAIECREDDEEIREILNAIHSEEGATMLYAERNYLQMLDSGCNAPVGAYCRKEHGTWIMDGMYAKDGVHPKYKQCHLKQDSDSNTIQEMGRTLARQLNIGTVYLVGAGPGDERLLTVRAKQLIQQADVIVYDSLISPSILQESKQESEWIYAGKRANHHHLRQEETNELLWKKAKEGKMVVRLKGGDPFIFGRGSEEALTLLEHEVPFEIVPGVSSCYSVPAYAGIPVTDRRHASSFHVITGHEQEGREEERLDYEVLAKETGTLIFLMGVKQIETICSKLIEYGKDPNTQVAVLSKGTTRQQSQVFGTLNTMPTIAKEQQIVTPAIIVVGSVVSFAQQISWFQGNEHFKKKVLLTGTKRWVQYAKEKVEQFGAQAIPFSLLSVELEQQGVDCIEQRLHLFDWIVFTSRNGVELFFEQWKQMQKDIRQLARYKFAVIGQGTAQALLEHGIHADFIPQVFSSMDMVKEWIPMLKKEEKVVFLRAKEGNKEVLKELENAHIVYEDVPLYHIVPQEKKKEELNRLIQQVDYIVLASGSVAKVFADMTKEIRSQQQPNYQLLSIGPVTTNVAQEQGLHVGKTAKSYCIEGILELLRE